MKTFLAMVLLLAVIAADSARAQGFVEMTAKTNKASKHIAISQDANNRTEQDIRTASVDVEIRHIGGATGKYQVQCFFISRNEASLQDSIFDAIVVETANPLFKQSFESLPLKGSTRRFTAIPFTGVYSDSYGGTTVVTGAATSSSVKTGEKIYGWIVRLVENGKVSRVESNQPSLKDMSEKITERLDAAAAKVSAATH